MKKNYLILTLTLLAFVILGYPLVVWGIDESFFYSLDPDVVYITNALLYTKANIITYIDHPGTPTIMFLYYLFLPLRLIAKFSLHQSFMQWSFDNYAFLTYYSRIFQLILSVSGLAIFLNLIRRFTKSNILTINAFFLTFLFAGLTSTLAIRPENFSFLLTACWLAVFTKFIGSKKYVWIAILAALSGFIFANKFTGVFLVVFTSLLPLFVEKEKKATKLIMLQANIAIFLEFFLIGIWPVWNKISAIVDWGLHLFGHADVHGTGTDSFLDWNTYMISLRNLTFENPSIAVFIISTIVLAIFLVIKKKIKLHDPVALLTLISFLGILVFAKYPVIHYNYINIFLLIYCFIYFLSKINYIWSKLSMLIIGVIFLASVYSNLTSVINNSPQKASGGVNAVLEQWTPFWSADIFREQFNSINSTKP
jgi:hypothetical protein